jgi:hypothetical protein
MSRAAAVALSALLCGCTQASPGDYRDLVEASRGCAGDSDCVLAGAGPCTCDAPVNQAAADDVATTAAEVDCQGATIACPENANLRCEAGRCVTDDDP